MKMAESELSITKNTQCRKQKCNKNKNVSILSSYYFNDL